MRSRRMAVAMVACALAAGGAVFAHLRAAQLRTHGNELLARSNAQAEEYASTFDGKSADSQLNLFEARREVLEKSHFWQRLQMLLILVGVVSGFAAYVFFLLSKLHDQMTEASGQLESDATLHR